VTSGPRRGRPRPRTAPGTSGSRHQGGRGRRTAPGPDAPAPATNKQSERGGHQKRHERRESRGRIARLHETQLTWKTRHAGPLWIHNASFNARLSEASWSRSSSQSPCSA
jgi:hypothetical protein